MSSIDVIVPFFMRECSRLSITSSEYQRFLEAHRVICSMSVLESCADNAAAESFFVCGNRNA